MPRSTATDDPTISELSRSSSLKLSNSSTAAKHPATVKQHLLLRHSFSSSSLPTKSTPLSGPPISTSTPSRCSSIQNLRSAPPPPLISTTSPSPRSGSEKPTRPNAVTTSTSLSTSAPARGASAKHPTSSSSRPETPNTMDACDDNEAISDTPTNSNSGTKVIYTPPSTISSSSKPAFMDDAGGRGDGGSGGYPEWWSAGHLAQQVGSLSKELSEMKGLLSKQGLDDEANDFLRLKQNHRSSLASLAELHRTEMAGLHTAHNEALRKLELQHMEELKDARRNNGHDRELLKGIHESYGKQIENLVLDLGEARREIKELKLKGPVSALDATIDDYSNRTLTMTMQFEKIPYPLNVAELVVPHPGPTFKALLNTLSYTVKNHLTALKNTANYFIARPRDEHVSAAICIKHWYDCAISESIEFQFILAEVSDGEKGMREQWEDGQWRNDDFVLEVRCIAEGWDQVDNFESEETVINHGASSASAASLRESNHPEDEDSDDSVSTVPTHHYSAAKELSRINKEAGSLHVHHQLASDSEDADTVEAEVEAQSEDDKENVKPQPRPVHMVTIEEVEDEDDMPVKNNIQKLADRTLPVLNVPTPPTAQPQQKNPDLQTPPIWEDRATEVRGVGVRRNSEIPKEYLIQLMNEARSSPAKWKFAASPLFAEEGKEDGAGESTHYSNSNHPPSDMEPLINKSSTSSQPPQKSWMNTTSTSTSIPGTGVPLSQYLDDSDVVESPLQHSEPPTSRSITRPPLLNITEERTTPPEAPEPMRRDDSRSGTEGGRYDTEPDTSLDESTATDDLPTPVRAPFQPPPRPDTEAEDDTTRDLIESIASTTPLLHEAQLGRGPGNTPPARLRKFQRMDVNRETPPPAPTVGGSPKTTTTTPRSKRRRSGYFHPNDFPTTGTSAEERWNDGGSEAFSGDSSVGDEEDDEGGYADTGDSSHHNKHQGNGFHGYGGGHGHQRQQQKEIYHRYSSHQNRNRPYHSPAPSINSETTTDLQSGYNQPSNPTYPNSQQQQFSNSGGSGPSTCFNRIGSSSGGRLNFGSPTPQQYHNSVLEFMQMGKIPGGEEAGFFMNHQQQHPGLFNTPHHNNGVNIPFAPNPPSLNRSATIPMTSAPWSNRSNPGRNSLGDLQTSPLSFGNPSPGTIWSPALHSQMSHPQLAGFMTGMTPGPEIHHGAGSQQMHPQLHRNFSSEHIWNDGGQQRTPMSMPATTAGGIENVNHGNGGGDGQGMMQHPAWNMGFGGPMMMGPNTPGTTSGGRSTAPPVEWGREIAAVIQQQGRGLTMEEIRRQQQQQQGLAHMRAMGGVGGPVMNGPPMGMAGSGMAGMGGVGIGPMSPISPMGPGQGMPGMGWGFGA